jgi:plastocyanin
MMRSLMIGCACLCLVAPPTQAADWGNVKGQIVFDGTPPTPKQLDVNKDQAACLAKGPIHSETWVVNPGNKGVKNVFVWLVSESGGKPTINPNLKDPPKEPAKLDQPTCAFEPHCQGIREGQMLKVHNSASIAHNVNWLGGKVKNPGGNKIIPANGNEMVKLNADKQPIAISCNIHPWMKGWIRVFDHPYFAVTDENGNFEIKDAPAGKLKMIVWQEDMGFLGGDAGKEGKAIEVKKGDNDQGVIKIKP